MTATIELKVHLARDEATGRWYIAESELPGLRLEADTVHDLIRQIEEVAPELIELNFEEISARFSGGERVPVSIRPLIDTPLAIAS